MAKSRSQYFADAGQALSQQNLPGIFQNAAPALALGDVRAAYYLCTFHHQQMLVKTKQGAADGAIREFVNFGVMYKLSEHFQLKGYAQFTHYFLGVFSQTDEEIKKSIVQLTAGYMHYLQTKQYTADIPVGVDIAHAAVQSMVAETVQYARTHPIAAFDMHAPPPPAAHGHDPHHPGQHNHHPEQAPLLGHEHSSKWCPCVLL